MFEIFLKIFKGGFIGKILGLLREVVLAWAYGNGVEASSFRISQTLILSPINLINSDVISSGFIPEYRDLLKLKEYEKAARLFGSILIINTMIGLFLNIFINIFIEEISHIFTSFNNNYNSLKILSDFIFYFSFGILPYVIFNIVSSVLAVHNILFFVSYRAAAQAFFVIIGIFASLYFNTIFYFAISFTLAYCFLMILSIFVLYYKRIFISFYSIIHSSIKFYAKIKYLIMVPLIYQVYYMVEKIVGGWISVDTISNYEYAKLFSETFVVLFCMPIGYAIILGNINSIRNIIFKIQIIVFFSVIVFYFFGIYFIEFVFQRGSFVYEDTLKVYEDLKILAPTLFFQASSYIYTKYLFSISKYGIVLKGIFLSAFFSILFMMLMFYSKIDNVLSLSFFVFNLILSFWLNLKLRINSFYFISFIIIVFLLINYLI